MITIDAKSTKQKKIRKILRILLLIFAFLEIGGGIVRLFFIDRSAPDAVFKGTVMATAILLFFVIIFKCVMHDAHLKLTDYDKARIKEYGLIHFTTLENAENIKRLRVMETNRKHFFLHLKNDGQWFYIPEGNSEQDILNTIARKKKYCRRFFDKKPMAVLKLKISENDINKCRMRLGYFGLNDEAICHLGIKLIYTKAEIYEFNDNQLKEIK